MMLPFHNFYISYYNEIKLWSTTYFILKDIKPSDTKSEKEGWGPGFANNAHQRAVPFPK
jgi:hypothetical protein